MAGGRRALKRRLRFSLALILGVLISLLLVALGFGITYYTYESQKKTALETTERILISVPARPKRSSLP